MATPTTSTASGDERPVNPSSSASVKATLEDRYGGDRGHEIAAGLMAPAAEAEVSRPAVAAVRCAMSPSGGESCYAA